MTDSEVSATFLHELFSYIYDIVMLFLYFHFAIWFWYFYLLHYFLLIKSVRPKHQRVEHRTLATASIPDGQDHVPLLDFVQLFEGNVERLRQITQRQLFGQQLLAHKWHIRRLVL